MTTVTLFSALAVQGALDDVILPRFHSEVGVELEITYDPTTVLVDLVRSGARPDVIIAVTSALDELGLIGALDMSTVVPIARAGVGVGVGARARIPDVSSVDGFQRALLGARSVAYSRSGASGIYFAELIERLGIADEVNSRATIVEKGFTAIAVLDGRADLAIQQLSELKFVSGIQIAGPLPEEVQRYTEFSAALGVSAIESPAVISLIRLLSAESSSPAYLAAGLLTGPDRA